MKGSYTIAVQWLDDAGEMHQNVYRNIPANRLQESADEFRKAQLDEAMRVEIREQVRAVLREQGVFIDGVRIPGVESVEVNLGEVRQ